MTEILDRKIRTDHTLSKIRFQSNGVEPFERRRKIPDDRKVLGTFPSPDRTSVHDAWRGTRKDREREYKKIVNTMRTDRGKYFDDRNDRGVREAKPFEPDKSWDRVALDEADTVEKLRGRPEQMAPRIEKLPLNESGDPSNRISSYVERIHPVVRRPFEAYRSKMNEKLQQSGAFLGQKMKDWKGNEKPTRQYTNDPIMNDETKERPVQKKFSTEREDRRTSPPLRFGELSWKDATRPLTQNRNLPSTGKSLPVPAARTSVEKRDRFSAPKENNLDLDKTMIQRSPSSFSAKTAERSERPKESIADIFGREERIVTDRNDFREEGNRSMDRPPIEPSDAITKHEDLLASESLSSEDKDRDIPDRQRADRLESRATVSAEKPEWKDDREITPSRMEDIAMEYDRKWKDDRQNGLVEEERERDRSPKTNKSSIENDSRLFFGDRNEPKERQKPRPEAQVETKNGWEWRENRHSSQYDISEEEEDEDRQPFRTSKRTQIEAKPPADIRSDDLSFQRDRIEAKIAERTDIDYAQRAKATESAIVEEVDRRDWESGPAETERSISDRTESRYDFAREVDRIEAKARRDMDSADIVRGMGSDEIFNPPKSERSFSLFSRPVGEVDWKHQKSGELDFATVDSGRPVNIPEKGDDYDDRRSGFSAQRDLTTANKRWDESSTRAEKNIFRKDMVAPFGAETMRFGVRKRDGEKLSQEPSSSLLKTEKDVKDSWYADLNRDEGCEIARRPARNDERSSHRDSARMKKEIAKLSSTPRGQKIKMRR